MDDKKPLVLVVEDEELLMKAIVRKLEETGHATASAIDGKKAIELLNTLPRIPDAIWLDFYLKDMNGLEFMEAMKKDSRFANIPVIVVSNSANLIKVERMLKLGVKKYILKAEHRLDDIIETINEYIPKEKRPKHSL